MSYILSPLLFVTPLTPPPHVSFSIQPVVLNIGMLLLKHLLPCTFYIQSNLHCEAVQSEK